MTSLNYIHGLVEVDLGCHGKVMCVDCDCGATLREVEKYAMQRGWELPFSAEIGLSTVGGTVFTTTKDSCIGESPLPGMGLGDVSSCLFRVTIVDEKGELCNYQFMDEAGNHCDKFQSLLDSQGTRGIAVRTLLAVRPKTPVTTTIHIIPFEKTEESAEIVAGKLHRIYRDAETRGGNIMAIVSCQNQYVYVEERIPTDKKQQLAPLSWLVAWILLNIKEFIYQRCIIPWFFRMLIFLSGSSLLRFKSSIRPVGYKYRTDVPIQRARLTFTFLNFPFSSFRDDIKEALQFTWNYQNKNGFSPNGFALYICTCSGKRLAGPFSHNEKHTFSFDPVHNDPLDSAWEKYVQAYSDWSMLRGALPSLNQTLGIERNPEWGSTAVHGTPSPRLTTQWLQAFFDAKHNVV